MVKYCKKLREWVMKIVNYTIKDFVMIMIVKILNIIKKFIIIVIILVQQQPPK